MKTTSPADDLLDETWREIAPASPPEFSAAVPIRPDWGCLPYAPSVSDPRLISEGSLIPARYYADQPYLVSTADGAWLCVVTTGAGHEGARGQHVVSMRSDDFGRTWSEPVTIEPADGPEASWAVPLVVSGGRIFVFYVYNADDIRELPADNPPMPGGKTHRMDSHGHYVFRWSDDHGRSWSKDRMTIPVREFAIDRENSTGGAVRLFWNVGRPLVSRGSVFLTLHKVAGFGAGWFMRSEGALVKSENLLLENDPRLARWETLPEGDIGLRAPAGAGPIAEEQSLLELSDGSFFCIYRSIAGHPVGCYSRDRGATWQEPGFLAYENGCPLKHPRAACFAWRLECGAYVLWFHNHGGAPLRRHPGRRDRSYEDRNPVWMSRGREVRTAHGLELIWEAPEIALYDDDPNVRMSYPDLREEGGRIYLTETQKAVARVHQLHPKIAHALRSGVAGQNAEALHGEAVLDWTPRDPVPELPTLPAFVGRSPESPYGSTDLRAGLSVELTLPGLRRVRPGLLAAAWQASFGGLRFELLEGGSVRVTLSDGRTEFSWSSDPGLLRADELNHVVVVVDGGPKILSFVVNGILCDGGPERQFGWGRFTPAFRGLPGGLPLDLGPLAGLRIYPRALLTTEARALFLAAGEGPAASSGEVWDFTVNPDFSETSSSKSALGATP